MYSMYYKWMHLVVTKPLKFFFTGQYSTVQYSTVQYSTVQYSTIQYNTIQYTTIQYNTIQVNTNNTLLSVPIELKKKITQAVKGAEWWLPVNGSYWKEPEGITSLSLLLTC